MITPKEKLVSFMESKGLIQYFDPGYLWDLSEQYSIDPGFVLSTFIWETGWGKVSSPWLNGYNPAGITCGRSYCSYASPEAGMESMYKLLSAYVDGSIDYVGKCTTVAEVRSKWSESTDSEMIVQLWRSIYD